MGEKYKYHDFSGIISDNGDRITIFKKDKHVYRNLKSFGIPDKVLTELITKGLKEVVIIWHKDDNTEEFFKTLIGNWKLGKIVEHTGYEVQRHIPISELRKITEHLVIG